MPKRGRQDSEEKNCEQTVKKQISLQNKSMKIRNIKNPAAEKTINMLFKASSQKPSGSEQTSPDLCLCLNRANDLSKCSFCSRKICLSCYRPCDICQEIFCQNCSFLMYDEQYDCMCYSCMSLYQ